MAENRLTRRPPEWWSEAKEWLTPSEKDNYFGVVPMVRNGLTATMNAAEVLGGYRSANEEDATKFLLDAWAPSGMAGALARPGLGTFGGRHAKQGPNRDFALDADWKDPGRADTAWQADQAVNIADHARSVGINPNATTSYETGGWFLGEDGMPRFEISDLGAKWKNADDPLENITTTRGARLGDILEHEELFSRYPALADMDIKRISGFDWDTVGAFDHGANTAFLKNRDSKEMLSTMLHELQHGIQAREGFARGGNVQQFLSPEDMAVVKAADEAWDNVYQYRKKGEQRDNLDSAMKNLSDKYGHDIAMFNVENLFPLLLSGKEIGPDHSIRMFKPHDPSKGESMLGYRKMPDEEFQPLIDDMLADPYISHYGSLYSKYNAARDQKLPIEERAFADYRDLAGEREARLVQNRLGLFPEQWSEAPPWNMESVPLEGKGRESPIVRFGDSD